MTDGHGPARSLVRVEDRAAVRTITLARPERHNALVPELLDDLHEAVTTAAVAASVRVVVLAADGASFSTGGDVAAFAERRDDERVAYARRIVGRLNETLLELLDLPQPVVAAVHGPVTGGSLGLVLASDVVVASPRAWFAPYYVDVGFSPDGGWTALLPAHIGPARALAVQLANDRVDAPTAQAWGLVTHLDDDAPAAAHALADRIAGKAPGSVRRTLQLLRPDREAVADALQAELDSFVDQIATDEATTGMATFLDSR